MKLFVVHTSLVSHQEINELLKANYPALEVHNIIDDSLLKEVSTVGTITPDIVARLSAYFQAAQSQGADLILNQCSSVGEAASIAAKSVSIPVVRIDQAMADQAVLLGERIAVVATVKSTVKPSLEIVKEAADKAHKNCVIEAHLIDGALNLLMNGEREKHNQLVLDKLRELEQHYDVIVLAQGSMTALVPYLHAIKIPVLTSPKLGIESLRSYLDLPHTL